MKYLITITDEDGREVMDKVAPNAAGAITLLQEVITKLRRPELPQVDCSFGEQPLPILSPSDEELAAYLNRASGVN